MYNGLVTMNLIAQGMMYGGAAFCITTAVRILRIMLLVLQHGAGPPPPRHTPPSTFDDALDRLRYD